jgi:pimeloyl-ACP methyl ester carboxylesterase
VQRDIENFRAALAGVHVEEAFLPAAAPTMVQYGSRNEYYPSDEAYVYALADALQEEYNAMVNAGFLLQIDAPELPATAGGIIECCEHWLAEERPKYLIEQLLRFLGEEEGGPTGDSA